MTTNNNNGVVKEHDFFSFQAIGGTKMLKFEGVGYDVGGHQKIHKGHNKH